MSHSFALDKIKKGVNTNQHECYLKIPNREMKPAKKNSMMNGYRHLLALGRMLVVHSIQYFQSRHYFHYRLAIRTHFPNAYFVLRSMTIVVHCSHSSV